MTPTAEDVKRAKRLERAVAQYAVFAFVGGDLVAQTPWRKTRDEAVNEAELLTDLGLPGNPNGIMVVLLGEDLYAELPGIVLAAIMARLEEPL